MTKYDSPLKIIKDITLMNNRFMNKVLDGNIPATQTMLRVILKNDKIQVKKVGIQQWLQNLYGHSAQLDILAEDEAGRQFNVEVQRNDEGTATKRARFYSSALDMHFLDSGKKYETLPESYVIFITENDALQEGEPIYLIDRYINGSGKTFDDGAHIIYVNASCKDDTPLGKLMQDFACEDPYKMHYKEIAERVIYLKTTKEGERDMTDIIELYAENVAKKAAQKAEKETKRAERIEFAQSLLADGMSIDFTARHTKLSLEEVRALAEKMSA